MTRLAAALDGASCLALDTEADSFHRYHEKVCLIQVSTEREDFLVDPLALGLPDPLRASLRSPSVTWVLHSGVYDVAMLKKCFALTLGRVLDTQVGAALLGHRALGLQTILSECLGVEIPKDAQRSDWGRRPLTADQCAYARRDTAFLLPLAEALRSALTEKDRVEWWHEESEAVRHRPAQNRVFDPEGYRKWKAAKGLSARGRRALKAAFLWREAAADARDLPPFRIAANDALVALARSFEGDARPRAAGLKMVRRAADRSAVWGAVMKALNAPTSEDADPPPAAAPRPPKPDAATRERMARLKAVRDRHAETLGLDPGLLLSSATMARLASGTAPGPDVEGLSQWRWAVLGDDIRQCLS